LKQNQAHALAKDSRSSADAKAEDKVPDGTPAKVGCAREVSDAGKECSRRLLGSSAACPDPKDRVSLWKRDFRASGAEERR